MSRDHEDAPAVKSREVLGYADDSPARYVKDLDGASSVSELQEALARWPILAADAIEQADAMSGDDWDEFTIGKNAERKGRFAGEEWARKYGAILMPAAMVQPALIAARYFCPFGTAYIRIWQTGKDKP